MLSLLLFHFILFQTSAVFNSFFSILSFNFFLPALQFLTPSYAFHSISLVKSFHSPSIFCSLQFFSISSLSTSPFSSSIPHTLLHIPFYFSFLDYSTLNLLFSSISSYLISLHFFLQFFNSSQPPMHSILFLLFHHSTLYQSSVLFKFFLFHILPFLPPNSSIPDRRSPKPCLEQVFAS